MVSGVEQIAVFLSTLQNVQKKLLINGVEHILTVLSKQEMNAVKRAL